jgi:hypothetical protein
MATEAAPERAELVWLQAQACSDIPGCDPESSEKHLQTLASSNGAGWMGDSPGIYVRTPN